MIFIVFQYGLVFGIYSLFAGLSSPIFGRYGAKMGSKAIFVASSFIVAAGGIVFGFLSYIFSTIVFLAVAYVTRVLLGIAAAGQWSGIIAICMEYFPNDVAKMSVSFEVFFSLGVILGNPKNVHKFLSIFLRLLLY